MSTVALPRAGSDRGRGLAVALLVALVVLAIAIIAVPFWLLHRHYDLAIADSLNKLDRYTRIASTRPIVAKELEAMRATDARRFYLRSGAAALSAAEAQEAVRSLVESSGGRLITMQAPVSRDEGHYRQMTANVQLTANIFALRKILHAIENNVPYLFVDNLTIRTQVPGNFKPAPGGEPEMFVQFDVSGYSLTGAP
jgi:general secretion pathway protein M